MATKSGSTGMEWASVGLALAKVEQWNIGLSAGAVAAAYALVTPHFATSLAAGAFLEAVNLGAIHRAARRLFAGELLSGGWIGGLALRFILLGTAIYLTMRAGAHPVALLIGLSVAMPATVIDAWLNRPPIVDPATLPVFLDDGIDEDEDDRIFRAGRLFTSQYSDRPEDVIIDSTAERTPVDGSTDTSLASDDASHPDNIPTDESDERTR
ncbi:MAG: hypothetical protein CL908_16765 [Deltaproteobacteria bacterium]|nr:hypothetical protein [Deltaproteobacteria bacterium]